MRTNEIQATSTISQNQAPAHQRNSLANARPAGLASPRNAANGSVFGGWGPRLG